MKRLFLSALFAIAPLHGASAVTAEQMQAILKTRPESDEIRWKDAARGAPLKVRVMSATAQAVIVEKQLATGPTVRTIPLADLAGIEFSLTSKERSLHESPDPAAIPALRVLWDARRFTMGLAGSNAAETGLALAKALRLSGGFDEASGMLDQIVSKASAAYPKSVAQAEQETVGFSRLLAMEKDPAIVEKKAWEIIEKDPEENPDLMLIATGYMAERSFSQLKSVEEENPRWIEDLEIKPQRDRLFNLALDFALYPSLFHGTRAAESAAGLAKVAEIYQFTGESASLKGALEDLIALYPESPQALAAAPLLSKAKQAEAAPVPDRPEAKPEAEANDSPAAPPPPPKRYSLFGD